MLRDTEYSCTSLGNELAVWPVLTRDPITEVEVPSVVDETLAYRSTPSTPDVPSSVGVMLFASYLALIGALAIATVDSIGTAFVIAISAFFVITFFTVPRFIFGQEQHVGPRPTLDRFLAEGMMTHTGHSTARAALAQMLIVPVALTAGVLAMAVVIALI